MRVLGIVGCYRQVKKAADLWNTGEYHDSAAVLVEHGSIRSAVEEERLVRRKHTGCFPALAIRHCLAEASRTLDDVDVIAVGYEGGQGEGRDAGCSAATFARTFEKEFGARVESKIRLVDHHTAHAMSAYYPSGFDDALIVTVDGWGDNSALTIMTAEHGSIRELKRCSVHQSLGLFYSRFLKYFGYGHFDEYKLMGLAAYGDPSKHMKLIEDACYELLPDGDYRFTCPEDEVQRRMEQLGPPRAPDGEFSPFYMDVAASVQRAYENIMFHVLSYYQRLTKQRSLCMAGGCAQNSVFNGRLAATGMFERIFVQPASNDAGTAIGAALHVLHSEGALSSSTARASARMAHAFLGPHVGPDADIEAELGRWDGLLRFRKLNDTIAESAELLAQNEVIGWVQGRSEFGPRSLGCRSILADPRPAANKDIVNRIIKEREMYRPFAPAVLEEHASTFFEIPSAAASAQYMSFTVPVKHAKRALLGATTHADGSARVQVVRRGENELFWQLIRKFGDLTDVPVLLNTSFNNNAEPIVNTTYDAVVCLLTTGMKFLVVGNFLVWKEDDVPSKIGHLTAALARDAVLKASPSAAGDGPPRQTYSIVRRVYWPPPGSTGLEGPSVSRQIFDLLSQPAQGPASTGTLPRSVLREVFDLWSRRFLVLQPSRSR
jgi:carbamoyltransferase